ncbi:hypothetical protein F5B20DRAFT_595528 [Whalleya microplaca]|nr:hypothetical protein F5B20DRAFT_595528 [Whalleya microplaca]
MCKGTQTQMSCGHILTHWTSRCPRACAQPSEGPPQPSYLPDTCAACDPGFRTRAVTQPYRSRRDELLDQLWGGASGDARRADVARDVERFERLHRSSSRAIGEAQALAFASALDVEFPTTNSEQPRGTCRWIAGKCVWTDEDEDDPAAVMSRKYGIPRRHVRYAGKEEEKMEAEPPAVTGPPRLRQSRKKYRDPFADVVEVEHAVVEGPPRLYVKKAYSGPRDEVVVREAPPPPTPAPTPVPAQVSRLRRAKKLPHGLSTDTNSSDAGLESDIVTRKPDSVERGDDGDYDSDRTIRPSTRNNKRHESSATNDIWMQMYDQ